MAFIAGTCQCRFDLRRVVGIIIEEADAIYFAAQLEAASCSGKLAEGLHDLFA